MQTDSPVFATGSYVIEPFLGLCLVVGTSQEAILGTQQLFYELKPQSGTSVIKIPSGQMSSRGVRAVMSASEMGEALAVPPVLDDFSQEPAAQRVRQWIAILRTGSHSGPASVLRQLRLMHKRGVKLTPKEVSLEQTVNSSLRQEIASAMNVSTSQAGLRLNLALEAKSS